MLRGLLMDYIEWEVKFNLNRNWKWWTATKPKTHTAWHNKQTHIPEDDDSRCTQN